VTLEIGEGDAARAPSVKRRWWSRGHPLRAAAFHSLGRRAPRPLGSRRARTRDSLRSRPLILRHAGDEEFEESCIHEAAVFVKKSSCTLWVEVFRGMRFKTWIRND
jgi:hypothetical protein